uniref:uncharacterized protein n=1 Tax=Centroberyx gerrardi TaxID=166262 RepID=UPI003AB0E691
MDGSGTMQSNEERAEKCMDDYLKSLGLHRKKIAKDGSCLFRAVAEQVLLCQNLHTKVRAKCVDFLKRNRESYEAFIEGDFEEYLSKLQDPQQWVGEVEINALSVMYKRDFLIFQDPGKPAVNITAKNFKDTVQLCFLNGNHYDSVYPISHMKSAAVCQSILYELLYDGVFKVERAALSGCQRVPRSFDQLSDDNMAACPSSDESDPEVDQPLWVEEGTSTTAPRHNGQNYRGRGRGRPLLPERVRRSLNPTLLRNVEYDVWIKSKRAQQKMDFCIAAGMHFTVGDRCQVCIDGGRRYNATIKEVSPGNGPALVYIEELGRKQSVPLWNLRPPSEESSWRTVVNRDKRLSNGHECLIGSHIVAGRGRGKPPPASAPPPSVSQATAPGSTGRVQKQHSWPPQAAAEEQGGARASRKSMSAAEPPLFGLTDKERLAREEEERNVALVEMQLRDEQGFPALGVSVAGLEPGSGGQRDCPVLRRPQTQPSTQSEGGRRKGSEKRRSQRNTNTKSPVEDLRAASLPAGERPKSSSPPLTTTTAATAPTTMSTAAATLTSPAPPAPPTATNPTPKPSAALPTNSDANRTWPGKPKAPTPNPNAAASTSASGPPVKTPPALSATSAPAVAPPTCAAPSAVTAHYYASDAAATAASQPPCAAPSAKTSALSYASVTGSVPPQSVPSSASSLLSLVTPALPPASLSSSTPPPALPPSPPSSAPKPAVPPSSSSLPPNPSVSPPPPSSSVSPPTFIAPIAPSPVAAQGFLSHPSLPRSASPSCSTQISSSSSSLLHHAPPVREAPAAPVYPPDVLPNTGGTLTASAPHTHQVQTFLPQAQASLPQTHTSLPQAALSHIQVQASLPQVSLPQTQTSLSQAALPQASFPQTQTFLPQTQSSLSQASLPQAQASLPQAQASLSQTQTSLPQVSVPHTQTQTSLPQAALPYIQGQASLPQATLPQTSFPQTQTSFPQTFLPQTQASLPQASLPQTQASLPQLPLSHLQPQYQYPSQAPEAAQAQSSHPAPGASYPHASQASLPPSAPLLSSVTQPHLHPQGHPAQPPHPSHLPHPSLSLSPSQSNPSLQTQASSTQSQTEVQPAPSQHPQPQPDSPAHPPSQQSHPPHPSYHPHFQPSPPPPHHQLVPSQSVPGAVPLQQLSQLYQDLLYPGFPQEEKGGPAPTPPYSYSQAGDDLPRDVNVLRFFFNLGVK